MHGDTTILAAVVANEQAPDVRHNCSLQSDLRFDRGEQNIVRVNIADCAESAWR
jgi:hypothetical protein